MKPAKSKVCRLKKALYGLKESPRAWYECFNEYVIKLGFRRSKYDYCLYVNESGKDKVYLLVLVDDLLICSKNKIEIEKIKVNLMKSFIMKDMG